jgi:hypothetical protein
LPVSLGKLIRLLELEPADNEVRFDFCYNEPTTLASYRGFYDQLALGYRQMTFDKESPQVRTLLDELRQAIGKTYQGYKGGDFKMDENTKVWVANYGDSGSTAIVGLANCNWMTIIETRWEE